MAGSTKRETLPIYRIKTIMKSSPGVENVSLESVHLVAKATELFLKQLARESLECNRGNDTLEYLNVATIVNRDSRYEFLKDMIPHKITVGKYKELMNGKNVDFETSGDSNSVSSDSECESI